MLQYAPFPLITSLKSGWHGMCDTWTLPCRCCVSASCWLPWIQQGKHFSLIQEGQSLECLPYLQFQAHCPCTWFCAAVSFNKKEHKIYKFIYWLYCNGAWAGGVVCLFCLFWFLFFLASHRISQFHNIVGLLRLSVTHSFAVLFRILFLEIGIWEM